MGFWQNTFEDDDKVVIKVFDTVDERVSGRYGYN